LRRFNARDSQEKILTHVSVRHFANGRP
jgi:hypothetical protein